MGFEEIRKRIEESDIITIFRHSHPDCDALGSQFGLKTWIEDNYPGKKVYALGAETSTQADFPASDAVDDETIRKSLAIVTDTSTSERADDQRFLTASHIIKIDHHPEVQKYGDTVYVDAGASAACEILGEFFLSVRDAQLSKKTAEYLYMGILTDTLCFKVSHVTGRTFRIASELADRGIDILKINRRLFDKSLREFDTANYIRSHLERTSSGKVGYVILTTEELGHLGLTAPNARNFIDEIGQIRDLAIWLMMTEKAPDVYDGSLRSKTIAVNGIAAEFRGGGHACASGVKECSKAEIGQLLKRLDEAAEQDQ